MFLLLSLDSSLSMAQPPINKNHVTFLLLISLLCLIHRPLDHEPNSVEGKFFLPDSFVHHSVVEVMKKKKKRHQGKVIK